MHDLIVIGGGPAGITAAAIAINQRLETLIVAEQWGGQTTYTMDLEDVEGRAVVSGEGLVDEFRRQLDYLDFVRRFDTVTEVHPVGDEFAVYTANGDCFESHALIVATGAKPKRLNVPGEERLVGRGLSYSATTHASLFLGKDVAVVGNGRRAQWATASLARKAHHVYLLAPEPLVTTPLADRFSEMENVDVLGGVTVTEVLGKDFVEGIALRMADGSAQELPVKGVFVKLRRTPNSQLVREWIDCDSRGHILVDTNAATSWQGVFAAGDVTYVTEQALVHIGEGAKAAISAYHYLLMH
ncbi:MAG: NAD(P)/FAD-dependent oxidoreductase [Anaerolineae bacterium]|jgi:thioredoxin reductase